VNERSLSHIPFRVEDELMIHSMARWMKFVGIVKIICALLVLFVALVALIYAGVEIASSADPSSSSKMGRLLADNKLTFFSLGAFALVFAVVGTAMGFVLYQAAEDFDRVVRTDEADQDYVASGLSQLETYIKVSVLLAFAAVLVGLTAGLGLAAKYGVGS
jgi:hypothetical protein